MNLVLYLLAMQISLALSVLWLGEGLRQDFGRASRHVPDGAVILGLGGLSAALYPLRDLFGKPMFHVCLTLVCILMAGWVSQCLLRPRLMSLRRQTGPWLILAINPAFYMTILHLVLVLRSLSFLGQAFAARGAAETISAQWLSAVMGLNLLAGALLLAIALAGVLALGGSGGFRENESEDAPLRACLSERLALNFWCFLGLIFVRMAATVFSLVTCAQYNPFGPRFFYHSLLNQDVSMMVLRVLMGIILPGLYAVLAIGVVREDSLELNHWIFLPSLLLVFVGELIALSLTVGLWGIAF